MFLLGLAFHQPTTTLHGLFTDNAVLQRDKKLPVWGTAAPSQKVTVSIAGQTQTTVASAHGNWVVDFKPIHEPGPYTLAVDGDHHLELHNILVGEVWICSGQSNMEFSTAGVLNSEQELSAATFPEIRLFQVDKRTVDIPLRDATGLWTECDRQTVREFSAVGFFFARELFKTIHVPIGLIEADWGGTPAEAWTPKNALDADPKLRKIVTEYEAARPTLELAMQKYQKDLAEFNSKSLLADSGNDGVKQGWAEPDLDDSTWKDAKVPGDWRTTLNMELLGGVWYRKFVDIPAAWAGREITLELGSIDDFDTTYFAGKEVGSTGTETTNWARIQRHYKIPGRLVKAGRNLIAVRVWNRSAQGGMMGGAPMRVVGPEGDPIPLEGTWRFTIEKGTQLDPNARQPVMPMGPGNPRVPASLYNGMIACLPPYGIRGVIWYQGEANTDRAYQYRRLFPAMIKSWRDEFHQGDVPFYFVQLPNFLERVAGPTESAWAELREAQAMALSLPATGMAPAIDLGEADNIHPKNKQEVGRRLSLIALSQLYGRQDEYSGPIMHKFTVVGNEVRLEFTHAGTGLVANDGPLVGFALAGADRKFHWAVGRIERDAVILSSKEVPHPLAVRYAWADNPSISLYNSAGLPAPPFRTDDWPGITAKRG